MQNAAKKITKSSFLAAEYKVVRKTGKVFLVATNNNRIWDDKLNLWKYIVNFRAITEENEAKVKALFAANPEGIEITDLNGLTMSCNIIDNGNVTLPIKGEKVECIISEVESKRRNGEKVLIVESILVKKAVEADSFSFDDEPAVSQTPSQQEIAEQSMSATDPVKEPVKTPVTAKADLF
jgi:hypothetical protein